MKIKTPSAVKHIINILTSNKYEAYIVGGCVRDMVIGKTPNDWDICTNAKPGEVKKLFKSTIDTGIKHGTVSVKSGSNFYEVTTFRKDGEYTDGRRPDNVSFVSNLVDDLSRRDFTMNAIAYDVENDEIIDPFDGMTDIKNRTIKCVGNPFDRFTEDKLRVLRAIRFVCQLDFKLDYTIYESIVTDFNNNETYESISKERINGELVKIIESSFTYKLFQYPSVVFHIIPELEQCYTYKQLDKYSAYDLFEHTRQAVRNAVSPIVKLALIYHDIGKVHTDNSSCGSTCPTDYAKISASIAKKSLTKLRFDKKTIKNVYDLVYYHGDVIDPSRPNIRKWLCKIGEQKLRYLIEMKHCDIKAQNRIYFKERDDVLNDSLYTLDSVLYEKDCYSLKDLAINGNDIISLGIEDNLIGKMLNKVLDDVMMDVVKNDKKCIINRIKKEYLENIPEVHY